MMKNMDGLNKEKEAIFTVLDNLYKKLKTIDESAQKLDQGRKESEIKEAMLGYIASFGLSMIKDLYLHNTDSVGFLLSIRCIIEGIAVYMYAEKKSISIEKEELFKLQSYFIEKEIYENYPVLDNIIFDLKTIIDNYESTKQFIVNKYNYSAKQIKKILQSRVPFLGNVRSFEKLIRENLPNKLLLLYKTISLYVHPYDYRLNDSKLFIHYAIAIFGLLEEIFKDVVSSQFGLEFEYNRVIGYNEFGLMTRELTHLQREKLNVLCHMLDDNGFNYLAFSVNTCGAILFDYFLDIAMGYTEQSTTKWKTSIENLWMLNLCIEDETFARDNELLHFHSRIKSILNLGNETTDDDFQVAYDCYKNSYPNGCDFSTFKKAFMSTTGYTINEKGEISTLRKSAFSLIDDLSSNINGGKMKSIIRKEPFDMPSQEDYKNIIEFDISAFLKMKYDESQAMSHASGYLYYCLSGAWYDGNLLAYLYEELLHMLLVKLLKHLQDLYKNKKVTKTIVNFLRNFIKDNSDYIVKKKQIYLMPKVKKNY